MKGDTLDFRGPSELNQGPKSTRIVQLDLKLNPKTSLKLFSFPGARIPALKVTSLNTTFTSLDHYNHVLRTQLSHPENKTMNNQRSFNVL